MGYGLGIDLGTTSTAAAVARGRHVEMLPLGEGSTVVAPSVVLAGADGSLVTRNAALRLAETTPGRLATGIRQRLGDPTPLLLGGTPQLPVPLLAALVRDTVAVATEVAGGFPGAVVLACPAVWGPYRRERFAEVPRLAGLTGARVVTEAEAVATCSAADHPPAPDDVVLVYDLGGATFDATVLRATETGWQQLGTPTGLDQVGGADLDDAVLAAVDDALDGAVTGLDPADPASAAVLARLRTDCVRAKEALSTADTVTVPVRLPAGTREVRLSRSDLERRVAPALRATLAAAHEALRSAGVTPAELTEVLLAGGSAALPLVARTVAAELGRPTWRPEHPDHAVAIGTALIAAHDLTAAAAPPGDPTTGPRGPRTRRARPDRTVPSRPGRPGRDRVPSWRRAPDPGRPWYRGPLPVAAAAVLAVLAVLVPVVRNAGADPTDRAAIGTSRAQPTVAGTIGGLGRRPQGIAVSGDGTRAWVPSVVAGTVQVIDLDAGRVLRTITTPGPPQYVALSPDGTRAYVSLDAPNADNTVQVLDTGTYETVGSLPAGREPFPPAVSPDGRLLYLPDHAGSRIGYVDTASDVVVGGFGVDPAPHAVVFSPNGTTAYVVNHESGTVQVIDVGPAQITATFEVGVSPVAVALSPDGSRGATADYDGPTVTFFDTATRTRTVQVEVGLRPLALAWAPDGAHLYVVDSGSDSVTVIDTRTDQVTATVAVGREPWSIAVDRQGRRAYVTNATGDTLTVLDTAD